MGATAIALDNDEAKDAVIKFLESLLENFNKEEDENLTTDEGD